MPHAKSTKAKNPVGLGRAIINQKSQDARRHQESENYSVDIDLSARLRSVTQEQDLDAFLSTAQLAGTDFTAERRNIKIVQTADVASSQNPHLPNEQEEKQTLAKQRENQDRLRVPRRPPWTKKMSTAELDRQEKNAFLEWRRGLAELQDRDSFLLTPFERNLEVWRQLWRVLERSHLVVQIVDARNPLRFRCEDLERYVADIEGPEGEKGSGLGKRKSLLLINKADLLTITQRRQWAAYFDAAGLQYVFYSAAHATALQAARQAAESTLASVKRTREALENVPSNTFGAFDEREGAYEGNTSEDDDDSLVNAYSLADGADNDDSDHRTRILTVGELEERFVSAAPPLSDFVDVSGHTPSKLVVGLVGYPNVGKSSTINSLIGETKVSVSSTPGKTKHFQTIQLSASLTLCDCPGLVFPQFSTSKADLVCDGVMPIDQLREHTGPVTLLVRRIPRNLLETIYGLAITVRTAKEGGDGQATAEDLLVPYAIGRGFMRAGLGMPDEARAARYVLKDYVNGKLLFCHPPPGTDEDDFNRTIRERALSRAIHKKKAPLTRVRHDAVTFSQANTASSAPRGATSDSIDRDFFANGSNLSARPFIQGTARHGQAYSRSQAIPHQYAVANDGTSLGSRNARMSAVLQNGDAAHPGKKQHKGNKRMKQRGGQGYD